MQLNTWHPSEDFSNKKKPGFGNKLANLIIKISGGMIKDERRANYALLALIAIIFIISFVVVFNATSSPAPSATEIIPAEY